MKKAVEGKELRTTHVVESVEGKPDTPYNFFHEQVAFRPCVILRLEVGKFGWIAVEPDYDAGFLHRVHTSPIINVQVDGDTISVETRNTFYRFRKVDDGELCRVRFDPDRWEENIDYWEAMGNDLP